MAILIELRESFTVTGKCGACTAPTMAVFDAGQIIILIEESNTLLTSCHNCGHWACVSATIGLRDLTRSEAQEIADHPQFEQARQRMEAIFHAKGFWG